MDRSDPELLYKIPHWAHIEGLFERRIAAKLADPKYTDTLAELKGLFRRAFAHNPNERYLKAKELGAAIDVVREKLRTAERSALATPATPIATTPSASLMDDGYANAGTVMAGNAISELRLDEEPGDMEKLTGTRMVSANAGSRPAVNNREPARRPGEGKISRPLQLMLLLVALGFAGAVYWLFVNKDEENLAHISAPAVTAPPPEVPKEKPEEKKAESAPVQVTTTAVPEKKNTTPTKPASIPKKTEDSLIKDTPSVAPPEARASGVCEIPDNIKKAKSSSTLYSAGSNQYIITQFSVEGDKCVLTIIYGSMEVMMDEEKSSERQTKQITVPADRVNDWQKVVKVSF